VPGAPVGLGRAFGSPARVGNAGSSGSALTLRRKKKREENNS
jgi:hypothetical protein